MGVDDGVFVNGIQFSFFCVGYNNVGVFVNGYGGIYIEIIEVNVFSCGYVVFVVKVILLFVVIMEVVEG